ncbi:hypothetical protein HanRHA438_Chr09g0388071 [Helianthus annuus]|nr:hypothetical protein HanIR_Chr09g0405881 [Helianthus annuus]KAJ0887202.1 hypothetical protein HanRHA438_Chr09g0388071 [Helianthus annuus]
MVLEGVVLGWLTFLVGFLLLVVEVPCSSFSIITFFSCLNLFDPFISIDSFLFAFRSANAFRVTSTFLEPSDLGISTTSLDIGSGGIYRPSFPFFPFSPFLASSGFSTKTTVRGEVPVV